MAARLKRRPRQYVQHGLAAYTRAARTLDVDPDWLTKLGPVGGALRSRRAEIIASLGGDENISAQERVVVRGYDEDVPVARVC